jgi:hypothetical protein
MSLIYFDDKTQLTDTAKRVLNLLVDHGGSISVNPFYFNSLVNFKGYFDKKSYGDKLLSQFVNEILIDRLEGDSLIRVVKVGDNLSLYSITQKGRNLLLI